MNPSRFFVDRPIFACVLSILIFLAGILSLPGMSIAEYPEVVPPSVIVNAQYPGANPKVIAETVITPIEEAISGVEDMLYMGSQANSDGTLTITIFFKLGTDPDKAQQLIQNRVAQSESRLPQDVRALGITTIKSSPNIMMLVHLVSPSGRYDIRYLRNYAALNIKDRLARIDGVGDVQLRGSGDYAMRIWLDPQKIAERGLSAGDIIKEIQAQNVQAAAGSIGAPPNIPGLELQLVVDAEGRLQTADEFGDIVVKSGASGEVVRLRDVARIEMGAADYGLRPLLNGELAAAIMISQAPGSNVIEIARQVRATMGEIKDNMPDGMDFRIVYDTTEFVRASIDAVVRTLLEAVALVVVVVILFLQTWRASIIPLLAVPVSIIGTFAILNLLGFSINALSLFGLVLATGIVVDDAIVVVENVERNIANGLSAREATYQAMREVSGPIIAIALVLVAVFVPLAFIPGMSGQFYKQFALTIAISTIISTINSLTLSPALSAQLLKSHGQPEDRLTRLIDRSFGRVFRGFNRGLASTAAAYDISISRVTSRRSIILGISVALTCFGIVLFTVVPTGFVPMQDKQYLVAVIRLPNAATLDRTEAIVRKFYDVALAQPGVEAAVQFSGLSADGSTNSSNSGVVFLRLKPFSERTGNGLSSFAIAGELNRKLAAIPGALIAAFPPPAIQGLGTIGGFKLQLEDRAGRGYAALDRVTKDFLTKAAATPELAGLFSTYQVDVPELFADIDRIKARQLGVPLPDIFETMQIYLGSVYVNDFNQFGRTYTVRAQADAPFRARAEDIGLLQVRAQSGVMIPLKALVTVRPSAGPERVMHYNGFLSADINGGPAPGFSSGQAQQAIARVAAETLPKGFAFEWTDMTYQQLLAGSSANFIFLVAILLVYLVLAAQYESLTLPLAVIMTVPTGLTAAMTGVWLSGGDNNIFTQIGFVVLVGMSAKNAILIVEFARELEGAGHTPLQAAIEASRLRLRPILMTSIAFIMGVVPLALSVGPGSEMRRAMGIAVLTGMLGVTVSGLVLTPLFYVMLRRPAGSMRYSVITNLASYKHRAETQQQSEP